MAKPRAERFEVDFPVELSWQVGTVVRRVGARCIDLSAAGAKLEIQDVVQPRTTVLVHSRLLGRLGLAAVKYCARKGMKHEIGVFFAVPLQLSDPARRRMLEGLIRTPAPAELVAEPERVRAEAMVVKR